jgi:hypothetical protein
MLTSNALWKSIEVTLDTITTEDLSKSQVCIGKGKICVAESMDKAFIDDMEVAGTTLLSEKAEGGPMQPQDILLGGRTRYLPKTMAGEVSITEEALEDNEYSKIIQPSKRLQASAWKTQDIDVANVPLRCLTVVGGYDGVVLASTAHTLPAGGTASNYLNSGTGMTPSPQALHQARTMAATMPGPNGLIDGVELESVMFPEAQLDLWKIITGTPNAVGNNYNDLNTVKDYGLGLNPVKWFDAVSTNFWACLTNAENGIRYLERRKIRGTTWVDNNCMAAHHGVSYRGAVGWSNWRHFLLGFAPT